MNKFQILDRWGKALPIIELDKEAAEFWGREVDSKNYATPKPEGYDEMSPIDKLKSDIAGNWYDIIGWRIANQGTHTTGWANVVHTLVSEHIGEQFLVNPLKPELNLNTINRVQGIIDFYQPYIDLINHWANKGYQPKQIKE